MLLVVMLILMFANLVMLLKGVLGYDFRDNRIMVIAGAAMIMLYWWLEIAPPDWGISLFFLRLCIEGVGTLLLFAGKKWNLFFSGVGMCVLFEEMIQACLGAAILIRGGRNIIDIDWGLVMIAAQLLIAAVLVLLWVVFKKNRKAINRSFEKLNSLVLGSFILTYPVFYFSPWSSGEIEYIGEIVRGQNQIKNGIVFFLFIAMMVLICIQITQRRELKKMLHLNEKCIREQTEQYRLLSNRDRELRKFRHDYNGHIIALQNLAESGSRQELVRYIEGLSMARSRFKLICSNNIICDAILNQYLSLCREAEIELKVKGNLPDGLLIPETDLCVIVSNAVKNAYEAVKQCSDKRKIQIEFSNTGNFASIQIINPAKELPLIRDGVFQTTKTDRLNHGIGVENMLEAAEKHGGKITWTCEDGIVITDILLRCKEK